MAKENRTCCCCFPLKIAVILILVLEIIAIPGIVQVRRVNPWDERLWFLGPPNLLSAILIIIVLCCHGKESPRHICFIWYTIFAVLWIVFTIYYYSKGDDAITAC